MSVGHIVFPDMPSITGLQLGAVNAGIKANERTDLVVIALPEGAQVAGVFTQNAYCAAPVTVCQQHLASANHSRYLVINSGNANACTGEQGLLDAQSTCAELVRLSTVGGVSGIEPQQVLPFSTGVIGEPLAVDKIIRALPVLLQQLAEDHWSLAAHGIMTTDTCPKGATRQFDYAGESIVINGIAKGAGMINPNMATMLGFIATNATIAPDTLTRLSKEAAQLSFNRITIDGDTSTNDSCMLITTQATTVCANDKDLDDTFYQLLRKAIVDVYTELAQLIVRDGEGATKFVTIDVQEGLSHDECLHVAYAIAHSPLVKTALYASDPNWGRIVAAIGYAGIDALDVNRVRIYLGDVLIVENGGRAKSYQEAQGQAVMNEANIDLTIKLGRGQAQELLWTTDLSHEYVTINAEYRS